MSELIDPYLRKYRATGETYPVAHPDSDNPDYEQEGEPLESFLEWELDVPHEAAVALASTLIERESGWTDGDVPFYASDANYVRAYVSPGTYAEEWEEFSYGIKHESRFFDEAARARVGRILAEPGSAPASDLPRLEIGPDTRVPRLFRAHEQLRDGLEELSQSARTVRPEASPRASTIPINKEHDKI